MFTTISAARQHVLCLSMLKLERPITLRGGLLKAFDLCTQETCVKVWKVPADCLSRILKTILQKGQQKNHMNLYKRSSWELSTSKVKQKKPQDFGLFENKHYVYTSG